jgi:hypothetical protein
LSARWRGRQAAEAKQRQEQYKPQYGSHSHFSRGTNSSETSQEQLMIVHQPTNPT